VGACRTKPSTREVNWQGTRPVALWQHQQTGLLVISLCQRVAAGIATHDIHRAKLVDANLVWMCMYMPRQ
jgi:hypothetical protein